MGYSYGHTSFVTPCSYLNDESVKLSLIYVDANFWNALGLEMELPNFASVPEEHEVLVHGDALEIVDFVILVVEIYEFLTLIFFHKLFWISLIFYSLP